MSLERKLQAWPPGRTYNLRRGRGGAGLQEMHTPETRKGWDMTIKTEHTREEEGVRMTTGNAHTEKRKGWDMAGTELPSFLSSGHTSLGISHFTALYNLYMIMRPTSSLGPTMPHSSVYLK